MKTYKYFVLYISEYRETKKKEAIEKIKRAIREKELFKILDMDYPFEDSCYGSVTDRFIELLETFITRDEIIDTVDISEALTVSTEAVYKILEGLWLEELVAPIYQFYCCDDTGKLFYNSDEIPDEITCYKCGKKSITLRYTNIDFIFI